MLEFHLAYVEDPGFGWSVECPEIPNLYCGDDDLAEAQRLAREAVPFYLAEFHKVIPPYLIKEAVKLHAGVA